MIFVVQRLVDILRPYADFVLPLLFVGFFIAAGLAIFTRSGRVRQSFLVGFLVVMVLFQTIAPVLVPPFMRWHKFSDPYQSEEVRYEIRVVDTKGSELKYDKKSTLSFNGVRMDGLRDAMGREFSAEENRLVAKFLLERAREYRRGIEAGNPERGFVVTADRSPFRLLRFPEHAQAATWTADRLAEHSRFVGIRLYRIEIVTSDDGSEIVSTSERVVYEHFDTHSPNRRPVSAARRGSGAPNTTEVAIGVR